MFIVYIIQSIPFPEKHYVGFTKDMKKRLQAHNAKKSTYSKKYSPWEIINELHFQVEYKARAFEIYLKSGSGHAFLKKHLI